MENPFTDAGFHDIEAGAELFHMMQFDPAMLKFPDLQQGMVELADFVNTFPEGISELRQIASKTPLPADELMGRFRRYAQLHTERARLLSKTQEIEKELSFFK